MNQLRVHGIDLYGQTRKRPAEASPQVPPVANSSMMSHNPNDEFALHNYSLDAPSFPPTLAPQPQHPQLPFGLDTYNIDNDPIMQSAGPMQQGFGFSPMASPMINGTPYSHMFQPQASMAPLQSVSSLHSPLASGYPSTVSTPQPQVDEQNVFFASQQMQYGSLPNFSHHHRQQQQPSQQQFVFNPNGEQMFSAISSSGPPHSYSQPSFQTPEVLDPSQILPHDYQPTTNINFARHENMFTFGADDDEDDDETIAFQDQNMMGFSPMDEHNVDMHGGYQWIIRCRASTA